MQPTPMHDREQNPVSKSPNILYVFTDQMRASAMGCAQSEPVHTPCLDRFAAQGVRFENAIANTPVCTPSRASLITGRHAWTCRNIVNDIRLPEEERSIADVLKKQGYRTGYIGKWHLDGWPRDAPIPPGRRRHGFDDYWAAYDCTHDYLHPRYYLNDDLEPTYAEGYDVDVHTDLAISFLEQFQDDPFCLFLSWGPPHSPYDQVPQAFLDQYPLDEIPLRPNVEGVDRAAIAGYYAHITALDVAFGRLMEALDRLSLSENTIVVFSSDHGDMLWAQGRVKKQQPWQESIGIPLIARWPDQLPAGEVSDLLVSVVDHAPTLLGLAGVSVPKWMNGLDLSPVLRGESTDEPQSAFIAEYVSFGQSSIYQPWRGVRTKRHTYARWLQGGTLLYDHATDPYELRNLVHEPGHQALLEDMENELQEWLDRLDDPFLPPDACFHTLGRTEEWEARKTYFPRWARRRNSS